MAENMDVDTEIPENLLNDLKQVLWGDRIRQEVFQRWSQGFMFSEEEPTALVQLEGGPCAVLAPVQAFILKNALLFSGINNWRKSNLEQSYFYLRKAMVEIIDQCKQKETPYFLVKGSDVNTDLELDSEAFHSSLKMTKLETIDELEGMYLSDVDILGQNSSVLYFLYSILLTKGIEGVKNERSDPDEPLIDHTHGYGNQSLINLMLTGRAVSHVWDNDRNISGLSLHGVTSQSSVGFLTVLEHLHYCEVGWFLKSPSNPVWVLGSETHLTVLFSEEKKLVKEETAEMKATRVFKTYDPEGNNFISSVLLGNVLDDLNLVSEPEYVEIMKQKLDTENLGIILLNSFMDEFFSEFTKPTVPDTFTIFHYNGLKQSCPNNKLKYQEGSAVLLECDIKCILESNPIQTCLQTKWPSIEIQWASGILPSLN